MRYINSLLPYFYFTYYKRNTTGNVRLTEIYLLTNTLNHICKKRSNRNKKRWKRNKRDKIKKTFVNVE